MQAFAATAAAANLSRPLRARQLTAFTTSCRAPGAAVGAG